MPWPYLSGILGNLCQYAIQSFRMQLSRKCGCMGFIYSWQLSLGGQCYLLCGLLRLSGIANALVVINRLEK